MSAEVTDQALLEKLNAPSAPQEVTDPALIERLNAAPSLHPEMEHKTPGPRDSLPFFDQVHVAQADNFDEKALYFEKKYGKSNVTREWGEDGKQSLLVKMPAGGIHVVGEAGFVAQIVGDAPKLIGMSAGAVAGAPFGGPVGSLGGAAIGAGIGKSLTEVQKGIEGTFSKTPKESLQASAASIKQGAEAQAGGAVAGKLIGKSLTARLPAFITGATPESRQMTREAWEFGAKPPYASMAPDAMKLRRIEVVGEKLTGKYKTQDETNMAYVIQHLKETLKGQGIPDYYVDEIAKNAEDPMFEISHEAVGQELKASVQAHIDAMSASVSKMAKLADSHIDAQLANVNRIIDQDIHAGLSTTVADAIRSAKKDFSEQATALYSKVDALVGNAKVVPVDEIVETAKAIKSKLPRSLVSQLTREASRLAGKEVPEENAVLLQEFGIEIPKGEKISIQDAQRMRTVLRDRGDSFALTRGVIKGDHLHLAQAVDRAIGQAGLDPAVKPAIDALGTADRFYKSGIAKFNDVALKQIIRATRSGMPPDPEKIVGLITQPGNTSRIAQLREVLGVDTWWRVQSVHMQKFMGNVTTIGEDGQPTIDGLKILHTLRDGDTKDAFAAVQGDTSVSEMREIGRMVAAREGKLDPRILTNQGASAALQAMKDHQSVLDKFMEKSSLSILADPTKTGEEAYQWVARPGAHTEARTMEVARTFGINSPQMRGVQQAAIEEVARNASINAIDKSGNRAIENALAAYTKNQQELLFPNGMADGLRKLSKVIQFMFPFKSGTASDTGMAGFEAGQVLSRHTGIVKRLYEQAVAGTLRFVVLHPSFARWIVTGREEAEFPWMIRTSELIDKMITTTTMEVTDPNTSGEQ